MTNREWINGLADEEFASWCCCNQKNVSVVPCLSEIWDKSNQSCWDNLLKWLKQDSSEEKHTIEKIEEEK